MSLLIRRSSTESCDDSEDGCNVLSVLADVITAAQ